MGGNSHAGSSPAPGTVKLPFWLWATLAAILDVVATGVADKLCWHSGWFEAAGLVVLGATLAAVVVYVFFTARLAEEAWSASASLRRRVDGARLNGHARHARACGGGP